MIVNEHVLEYINSLEGELGKHLQDLKKTAEAENVPIIKKETATLIRFLLTLLKPSKILEVGTATGFSAIFMSEYMPENCTITTIEKVEMRLKKARINLSSCPKSDKITLLEGDALVLLEELANRTKQGSDVKDLADYGEMDNDKDKNIQTFDFIFLDAAKGQYIHFLPYLFKLLSEDGILITDNVLQGGDIAGSKYAIRRRDRTIHTRMREYLYELTHMDALESVIIPVGDGVTLSTKRKV